MERFKSAPVHGGAFPDIFIYIQQIHRELSHILSDGICSVAAFFGGHQVGYDSACGQQAASHKGEDAKAGADSVQDIHRLCQLPLFTHSLCPDAYSFQAGSFNTLAAFPLVVGSYAAVLHRRGIHTFHSVRVLRGCEASLFGNTYPVDVYERSFLSCGHTSGVRSEDNKHKSHIFLRGGSQGMYNVPSFPFRDYVA